MLSTVNAVIGRKDIAMLIHYAPSNTAAYSIKHQQAEFQEEIDKLSGVARTLIGQASHTQQQNQRPEQYNTIIKLMLIEICTYEFLHSTENIHCL